MKALIIYVWEVLMEMAELRAKVYQKQNRSFYY